MKKGVAYFNEQVPDRAYTEFTRAGAFTIRPRADLAKTTSYRYRHLVNQLIFPLGVPRGACASWTAPAGVSSEHDLSDCISEQGVTQHKTIIDQVLLCALIGGREDVEWSRLSNLGMELAGRAKAQNAFVARAHSQFFASADLTKRQYFVPQRSVLPAVG